MKTALMMKMGPYLASVVVCALVGPLAQFAAATVITGTRNFEIVQRLTGPNITGDVGVGGTDLGHMVNHNGKTYFLFGDTNFGSTANDDGPSNELKNVMAWTTDTDPTNGITFDDWITHPNGKVKQVIFPGAEPVIPGFNPVTYIPTGAISVGDKIYAWNMRVDWSGGWEIGYAGLARWREGDSQFTTVPGFRFETPGGGRYSWGHGEQGPGNFGMVAASHRSPLENANDPHIYIWGTPGGRNGGVKLARVLPNEIENLSAYEFFDGEIDGVPQWVDNEFDAEKIIPSRPEGGGGVGEMSVMYNEAMRAWTLMYIGESGPGFHIRYADNPWGPWSDPVDVRRQDQSPGLYAPYMNSLYVEDGGRTLYFTMSLWNPYDVYLAKVDLDLDFRTRWSGNIGTWAIGGNWSHGRPTAEHHTTLDNGGKIRLNTAASVRALDIGTGEGLGGTLEISGAAVLTIHDGGFRLGQHPGSDGTLTMTGGSVEVLDTNRLFVVGDYGSATAAISGGSITARTFSIAHQPTASGHVELSGDAVITVTGNRFQMGRLRNASTGERPTATLTMTGGTINVNAGGGGVSLPDFVAGWEGVAAVDMSGGTINVANNFVAAVAGASGLAPKSQATIAHSGGTINTGGMILGERGISDYTLYGTGQISVQGLMQLGRFAGSQSTFTQTGGSMTVGNLLRIWASGTLNLNGGRLTAAAIRHDEGGSFNFTGGTFNVGTFTGNLTNAGGALAPGAVAGLSEAAYGTTNITGNYDQQTGATLALEIGGQSVGTQHDSVVITGNANLDGELRLTLIGGYVPSATDAFTVLSAGGAISGTFNNVAAGQRLETLDGTGSFLVHYGVGSLNESEVVLTAFELAPIPGDFNQDGVVDAADYVVWRRGLADGTMTDNHYNEWRANFGASAASTSAVGNGVGAAVPEPYALLLFALGLLAFIFRWQPKRMTTNRLR